MSDLTAHNAHIAVDGGYALAVRTIDIDRLGIEMGTVTVTVCTTCLVSTVTCDHAINTWVTGPQDTEQLVCQLCGKDVT